MKGPDICRRAVLAGGAGAAATLAGRAGVAAPAGRLDAIGLQLYTLRQLFAPDPLGTLERVATIGYREVEFGGGGYESMDHAALRQQMDRFGLTAPSLHMPYAFLLNRIDAALGAAEALGARIIVVPWIEPRLRGADAWPAVVATLNRFGERLGKAGLQLAYHNHDFEFTQTIGKHCLFDLLLQGTDPALVALELDLFWTVTGGQDPAALVRKVPGRIIAYHVKDRARDGSIVGVGAGMIDFAPIFRLNATSGARHFFVEHDFPVTPFLPSVAYSYQTLRNLTF